MRVIEGMTIEEIYDGLPEYVKSISEQKTQIETGINYLDTLLKDGIKVDNIGRTIMVGKSRNYLDEYLNNLIGLDKIVVYNLEFCTLSKIDKEYIEKYFIKYSQCEDMSSLYMHKEFDDFQIIMNASGEVYQLNSDHIPQGIELMNIDELKWRFKSFTGEEIECDDK